MDHPNVAVVMRALKAFREDHEGSQLAQMLAPEASWHVGGNNPLTGDYHGRDEVAACHKQLLDLMENTARVEPHDILASDDHVVVLARVMATREGTDYSGNLLYIFHVSDELITEGWVVQQDQDAWDRFSRGLQAEASSA